MTSASRASRSRLLPAAVGAVGNSLPLVLAVAACSPDSSGSSFKDAANPGAASGVTGGAVTTTPNQTGCAAIAQIHKVRERTVGGGGQVVVRLENAAGAPLAAAQHAECLELAHAATGHVLVTSTGTSEPDAVRTMLVMAPTAAEPEGFTLDVALALIQQIAPDEQIGLYSAEAPALQLSTLRSDAGLLRRLAERAVPVTGVEANNLLTSARELSDVGRGLNWLRRVVLVAPSIPVTVNPALDFGGVAAEFVVAQDAAGPTNARIHPVELGTGGAPAAVSGATSQPEAIAERLNQRLAALRTAGFVHIGYCPDNQALGSAGASGVSLELPLALSVRVRDRSEGPQLPVSMLAPPPEEADLACAPETVATDWPQVTSQVKFRMTASERAIYDDFVDANDKSDFELSVQPAPTTGWTLATAHLRGVSSLSCERKGYTVDLQEPLVRYTLPGLGTDEIQLIAMCLEDEPIHHNSAHALMHQLDLSIIGSQLVELLIDDESAGAYLLLEKHKELFLRSHTRVRSVLRRDMGLTGGDDEAEVKFTADAAPDGEADYLEFLASLAPLSGPALETAVRNRLHLDQYLRWLALMSLLHSGDYSDEVFLIGTETRSSAGLPVSYFHINGWDADDIFQDCHFNGQQAVEDDFELTYCAESELDHKLMSDPHTYGLYVDALSYVIEQIPTVRFRQVVDEAAQQLLSVLSLERARLAMLELLEAHPGATDLAVLETVLTQRADELELLFDTRRTEMSANIEAYRAQLPSSL